MRSLGAEKGKRAEGRVVALRESVHQGLFRVWQSRAEAEQRAEMESMKDTRPGGQRAGFIYLSRELASLNTYIDRFFFPMDYMYFPPILS